MRKEEIEEKRVQRLIEREKNHQHMSKFFSSTWLHSMIGKERHLAYNNTMDSKIEYISVFIC